MADEAKKKIEFTKRDLTPEGAIYVMAVAAVRADGVIDDDELSVILRSLEGAVKDSNQEALRSLLMQIVPGFKPQCGIEDILYKK